MMVMEEGNEDATKGTKERIYQMRSSSCTLLFLYNRFGTDAW